jgi:hypothetical protein
MYIYIYIYIYMNTYIYGIYLKYYNLHTNAFNYILILKSCSIENYINLCKEYRINSYFLLIYYLINNI